MIKTNQNICKISLKKPEEKKTVTSKENTLNYMVMLNDLNFHIKIEP